MFKLRFVDRLKYIMERTLDGGPFGQLLLVVAVVVFVAVAGGLAMYLLTPTDAMSEEVWWSFLRLTDPGYLGDDHGLWRRVVSVILTILGYVLFMGTLVAIMTQWLTQLMRHLEQGHTPITFASHRVVLGWTSRTLPILRELLEHGEKWGAESRIAVLADDITEGPLSDVYNDRWRRSERRRVVLRSGSTLNPEHLHRVAIEQANTVIIPRRSNEHESQLNADADIIKVLLSIDAQTTGSEERPLVVAELLDATKIPVALHTYKGPLQIIPSNTVIARMIARSVVYTGLLRVLNAMLIDEDYPYLVPKQFPSLVGKNWADVYSYFDAATPCGLIRQSGGSSKTLLAPPLDTVLTADDWVVLLADSDEKPQALRKPMSRTVTLPAAALVQRSQAKRQRILILGWSSRVPRVLEELANVRQQYFDVTIVSSLPTAEREQVLAQQLDEAWSGKAINIQEDYTEQRVQEQLQPNTFDSILLFSSDRLGTDEEADARSIVAFMVLNYLLSIAPKERVQPHILLELQDQSNAVYVSHTNSDLMVSSVVISHVLAQVALHPSLRSVYDDLLSSDGAHLGIRYLPESLYGELSIAQVQSYVLAEGGVLLGVSTRESELVLNPDAQAKFTFGPESQLIVIQ